MAGKKIQLRKLITFITSGGGLLLILLVFTILPFFILSLCNHPCSDDYAETNLVHGKGFWGAQAYYYFKWMGRYFCAILISINPLVFNSSWAYKLNAIVWLLMLLFSVYWLSGKLFNSLERLSKIGITTLFVFAYLMRMPDVASGLFWQSGIYALLTPSIMSVLLMGTIIGYYKTDNKLLYLVLSCLLAIAIIGSYELNLIYIDIIVLIITFINVLKKKKPVFLFVLLTVCVVFSIISVKAPGNSVRGLDYPHAHKLIFSIKESVIYGVKFLLHWLSFMLLIILLLIDLLSGKHIWDDSTHNIFVIKPWFSLIACIAIPFIGLFVCFWAEGEFPPLRTVNVSYFYFVGGMMYFSFTLLVSIKKRYPHFIFPPYIKIPIYCLLGFTLLLRTNNITVAYKDVTSGTAFAYNKERIERDIFLRNFKGDSCMIDSVKDITKSLFFSELPRDKSSWINTSFSAYYHKKSIVIRGR